MIFAYRYDIGCKRSNNEDAFYIPQTKDDLPGVMIVADGMGGHNAGEIASKTAVDTVLASLTAHSRVTLEKVRLAIKEANSRVYKIARSDKQYHGMGTTLIVAVVEGHTLHIAHIGDSRAYLFHEHTLEQITKDHSFVQKLIDDGVLTQEEAKEHPYRNVITHAIGVRSMVKPDTYSVPFGAGDTLLLCTDGMSKYIDDTEIKEALSGELESGLDHLLNQAKLRGGEDNITILAMRWEVDCHE